QPRGRGFGLVPRKPEQSELRTPLPTPDDSERMPPPKTGKKLKPEQIELIRQWIAGGATWSEHWAFTTPRRPALPQVKNPTWGRNPVDAFILARLESEGLAPSPEAEKTALLRRVAPPPTRPPPPPAEG